MFACISKNTQFCDIRRVRDSKGYTQLPLPAEKDGQLWTNNFIENFWIDVNDNDCDLEGPFLR